MTAVGRITEQFSAEAFRRAHDRGPVYVRELADRLQDEVERELQPAIERVMQDVVDTLNAMGHRLERALDRTIDDIAYYDSDPAPASWDRDTKLRLAHISNVAAGYRDMVREEDYLADLG